MNMDNKQLIIDYWIEKSKQDIDSARDNFSNLRLQNAVRDLYFSFFHAFSALLFHDGKSFKKHRQVRAIFHRDYIKEGLIELKWGKKYDWLFDNRQKADYRPLAEFDTHEIEPLIDSATEFVEKMVNMIAI